MLALILSNTSISTKLWKSLLKNQVLSKKQLENALKQSKEESRYLTDILLKDKNLDQERVLDVLAGHFNLPKISLKGRVISPQILNLIPKELAEQRCVIIFKKWKDSIDVATTCPEDSEIIKFINKKTGLKPDIFLTTPEDIAYVLKRYKGEIGKEFGKIIEESTKEALAFHSTAEKMAQYVPVIQMVRSIIEQALSSNASDIHIEPRTNKVAIRFRIDGLLHDIVSLPKEILPPITTRIKIMSDLKIDEHRRPQDGRFQYIFGDQEVAVRVSVIPTLYGSKIAMRLLEMKQKNFTLRKLGLNKNDFSTLKREITSSQGMILATGPTGSGKTTTLYTILRMLNNENVNICTIEDPIEYGIDGINQTQINPGADLTFATGLKSLLRQDPNIVMVGEIRDKDTAQIAVDAAMTGHLVLSTLHTNSAFLTPQRLVEMGIEPYLVSPVLNLVIGQRLVRKICPNCKIKVRSIDKFLEEYVLSFDLRITFNKLKKMGRLPKNETFSNVVFYKARGCNKCNHTGYHGRLGIYEVLKMDNSMRRAIIKDSTEEAIRNEALKKNVLTMAEDGLLKVFTGKTTLDEVLRVTKI